MDNIKNSHKSLLIVNNMRECDTCIVTLNFNSDNRKGILNAFGQAQDISPLSPP